MLYCVHWAMQAAGPASGVAIMAYLHNYFSLRLRTELGLSREQPKPKQSPGQYLFWL